MKKMLLFLLICVVLLLTPALVTLKLAGVLPVATWSWCAVTAPLWVPVAAASLVRIWRLVVDAITLAHR